MGITKIVYRRPLHTNEPINDKPIPSSGETYVIAAIGPLSSRKEAYAHGVRDKNNGIYYIQLIFKFNDHFLTKFFCNVLD